MRTHVPIVVSLLLGGEVRAQPMPDPQPEPESRPEADAESGQPPEPEAEPPPDDTLEAEIQAELDAATADAGEGGGAGEGEGGEGAVVATDTTTASARGLTNTMNPAISVIGLFRGAGSSAPRDVLGEQEGLGTGLTVPEVEVAFSSVVDPYLRADVYLAVEELEEFDIEEAFVTTLSLPAVTVRAGKFLAAMGKHNTLHTHLWPFLDPPLANEAILGEEGLSDPGVGASVLVPVPWFLELTVDALDGTSEELFDGSNRFDLAYVGHLRSLWDLSDASTIEVGASAAAGQNSDGEVTRLWGGDLTFRWRPPSRAMYRSFQAHVEYLAIGERPGEDDDFFGGIVGLLRFQFARRWWIQTRHCVLGLPALPETEPIQRTTGLMAFVMSEFSLIRLQYSYVQVPEARDYHEVAAQLGFLIGSHPAHPY